jgi:predicted Zn-dependent protease
VTEAIYFDGRTSKKRVVSLNFGKALEIVEDGAVRAAWPYADIRRVSAEGGVWRLCALGAPELARLELRDPELHILIAQRCRSLASGNAKDVSTAAVIGWSLAAVASIIGLVWFGAPYAAERVAPIIPLSIERRVGEAAENQIRAIFPGNACNAPAGVAALQKLSQRLQSVADLRLTATIVAQSSKAPNAFALPGGKVYLLSGLLAKAQSQDEIVGVLAHELGHLQHRDHIRKIIADGGAAYLIGLLFGDVSGGGALIFVGKTLLFAAHSREVEAAADAFAAQTLEKLGRPARPMGELLERVTGPEDDQGLLTILHDHPLTKERLDYLAAQDRDRAVDGPAILSDAEWNALKRICE